MLDLLRIQSRLNHPGRTADQIISMVEQVIENPNHDISVYSELVQIEVLDSVATVIH